MTHKEFNQMVINLITANFAELFSPEEFKVKLTNDMDDAAIYTVTYVDTSVNFEIDYNMAIRSISTYIGSGINREPYWYAQFVSDVTTTINAIVATCNNIVNNLKFGRKILLYTNDVVITSDFKEIDFEHTQTGERVLLIHHEPWYSVVRFDAGVPYTEPIIESNIGKYIEEHHLMDPCYRFDTLDDGVIYYVNYGYFDYYDE